MKLSETLGMAGQGQATDSAEIVVLHTGSKLTPAAIEAAANLTKGLNFRLVVIAVHILPYPLQLTAVAAMKEHLEAELARVTERSAMPVAARIVFARDMAEAFRQSVHPESLVLIGERRRWWPTRASKWARDLAKGGFRTALIDAGRRNPQVNG